RMKDEERQKASPFHPSSLRQAQGRLVILHPFLLISVAFVGMLTWTWLRWPDPIVDFGRELYLPWQVSQGKQLYRDLAHFNGPLSVYFNALAFLVLGVSLRTIVVVNILVAAGVVALIWRLGRR